MADLDPFDEYGDQDAAGDDDQPTLEPRSSRRILQIIKDSEKEFQRWMNKCDRIDKLYSALQSMSGFGLDSAGGLIDKEFNLFWASVEVIKPSIYSRPPVPVVAPKFKDRNPVKRTTAEMLERTCISGFDVSDIDQVMLGVRDDLVINARGVTWLSYETKADSDTDHERVCIEHLDRNDFGHEWGRKWSEVGIVWRHAWLTKREARKRFRKRSGDLYQSANYGRHKDELGDGNRAAKARFTEVWNKYENQVQWVAEGCDTFLDEDKPHLKLSGFFPCPRPAYGTMERRSLVPVPDISYIEDQLEQINLLTARIHGLVQNLQVKGLYPAGGDIGTAVEMALKANDDSVLVPVNAATLSSATGMTDMIVWLPIDQIASTIVAAVEARRELISNVQELFGIADIMRGDTQAQETLGAQQLKAQFGAVRIRDRIAELVRIARDTVVIMAEIMAEHFSIQTIFDMSQMELPTKAEVQKQIDELRGKAEQELKALNDQAEQAMAQMQPGPDGQAPDPQQIDQQIQQASEAIKAKYLPQIEKAAQQVTQEAVKEMLRDNKTRPFTFDIETDSTIYPDEMAEKTSRNEFMTAFTTAAGALAPLVQTGPAGAKMAGELIKFQLGPYRAGRQLEGMIDEWVDSLADMPQNAGNGAEEAIAEANKVLAQAEMEKARAAIMTVESRAAKDQAENERKMMELQQKAADGERTASLELATTQAKLEEAQAKVRKTEVDIEHVNAQIAAIFAKIGVDAKTIDLNEFKTVTDVQFRADDQARQDVQLSQQATESEFEREQRLRGEDRQDRSQTMAERQAEQAQRGDANGKA